MTGRDRPDIKGVDLLEKERQMEERHKCVLSFEDGKARCLNGKTPCPNLLLIHALNLDLHNLREKRLEVARVQREIQDLEESIRNATAELTDSRVRAL